MSIILNRYKDKLTEDSVLCDRSGKYGNPFKVDKKDPNGRSKAIRDFELYFIREISKGTFTKEEIANLYTKELVCTCKPLPCHCDVISRFATSFYISLYGPLQVQPVYVKASRENVAYKEVQEVLRPFLIDIMKQGKLVDLYIDFNEHIDTICHWASSQNLPSITYVTPDEKFKPSPSEYLTIEFS